jgi:hypothetical protein
VERALVTQEKQLSPKKSQLRGIRSLDKMQQGIIRITAQYTDGSPIEPKGVLSKWRNDCGVVVRKNARSSSLRMMLFQKTCKKPYGDSSKNITFSLLSKKKLTKMLH